MIDKIFKLGVTTSLVLISLCLSYRFIVYLPAREDRLDARQLAFQQDKYSRAKIESEYKQKLAETSERSRQEQVCSKSSQEYFAKLEVENSGLGDKNTAVILDYTNHFSYSFNKCFLVFRETFLNRSNISDSASNFELHNVYEHKKIGHLYPDSKESSKVSCDLDASDCRSRDDWDGAVRVFMND